MPFRSIVAALLAGVLAGCASGANSQNMTASITPAHTAAPNTAYYQSIGIAKVTGGTETNPMLMSQVSDGSFKDALKSSLFQSSLLAIGPEKYRVSVEIRQLSQPLIGLDMSVTSNIRYVVTRVSDNAVVYDKLQSATHTATVGDSMLGVERLRLANEGSIRKNIASFMAEVARA